jgi:hypothetical protein
MWLETTAAALVVMEDDEEERACFRLSLSSLSFSLFSQKGRN